MDKLNLQQYLNSSATSANAPASTSDNMQLGGRQVVSSMDLPELDLPQRPNQTEPDRPRTAPNSHLTAAQTQLFLSQSISSGLKHATPSVSSAPPQSKEENGHPEEPEDFPHIELSLQDIANVKSLIPDFDLSRPSTLFGLGQLLPQSNDVSRQSCQGDVLVSTNHQQQQPQQSQFEQFSPSCDQELQTLADLVSSTLEQEDAQEEMEIDLTSLHPQGEECQRQAAQAKTSMDLFSIPSASQQNFLMSLSKQQALKSLDIFDLPLSSDLPMQSFQASGLDKPVPSLSLGDPISLSPSKPQLPACPQPVNTIHSQEQPGKSSQTYQTLAPIQTLMNSLRKKNQPIQPQPPQTSIRLEPETSNILSSTSRQSSAASDFSHHHHHLNTLIERNSCSPKLPEDKEIKSYFKSMKLPLDNEEQALQQDAQAKAAVDHKNAQAQLHHQQQQGVQSQLLHLQQQAMPPKAEHTSEQNRQPQHPQQYHQQQQRIQSQQQQQQQQLQNQQQQQQQHIMSRLHELFRREQSQVQQPPQKRILVLQGNLGNLTHGKLSGRMSGVDFNLAASSVPEVTARPASALPVLTTSLQEKPVKNENVFINILSPDLQCSKMNVEVTNMSMTAAPVQTRPTASKTVACSSVTQAGHQVGWIAPPTVAELNMSQRRFTTNISDLNSSAGKMSVCRSSDNMQAILSSSCPPSATSSNSSACKPLLGCSASQPNDPSFSLRPSATEISFALSKPQVCATSHPTIAANLSQAAGINPNFGALRQHIMSTSDDQCLMYSQIPTPLPMAGAALKTSKAQVPTVGSSAATLNPQSSAVSDLRNSSHSTVSKSTVSTSVSGIAVSNLESSSFSTALKPAGFTPVPDIGVTNAALKTTTGQNPHIVIVANTKASSGLGQIQALENLQFSLKPGVPLTTSNTRSSDTFVDKHIWANIQTPQAQTADKKATLALLDIVKRPEIRDKLASNTFKKKDVWNEIGNEMAKVGYKFADGGEKCSQKWRNLVRAFKEYEELKQKIPDKAQPDFHAEIHALLREKLNYKMLAAGEVQKRRKRLLSEYVESNDRGNNSWAEAGGAAPQRSETATASHVTATSALASVSSISPHMAPLCISKDGGEATHRMPETTQAGVSTTVSGDINAGVGLPMQIAAGTDPQLALDPTTSTALHINSEPAALPHSTAQHLSHSHTAPTRTATPVSFNQSQSVASSSISKATVSAAKSTAVVSTSNTSSSLTVWTPLDSNTTPVQASPSPVSPASVVKASDSASSTVSLTDEVQRLNAVVTSQSQEIQRLSSLLTSVETLLSEQRRDAQAVRAESSRRFTELKALIAQNQREKMQFMYDFLKAFKPPGARHCGTKKMKSHHQHNSDG